jgi:hypothetical protein
VLNAIAVGAAKPKDLELAVFVLTASDNGNFVVPISNPTMWVVRCSLLTVYGCVTGCLFVVHCFVDR